MEMTQETSKARVKKQAKGCIQLGDLLIFAFGAFIMFAKTADLLGKFAPADWFGLAPTDYGIAFLECQRRCSKNCLDSR